MPKAYSSAADYEIVHKAIKEHGAVSGSIVAVCRALTAVGIEWPCLNPTLPSKPSPEADAVDSDILRAWKELGLHPSKS